MNKSESIANLAKAIVAVTQEVKNIEKNTTVGSGSYAYKGVSDKDVKEVLRTAMANHGLSMVPVGVDAKTQIDRWQEGNNWKQSVFTEVNTSYLLMHESGEFVEIQGYGHGVDSQDKGAGKATTYSLKYALLYTFLIPTGTIDDADNEHSSNIAAPKTNSNGTQKPVAQQPINNGQQKPVTQQQSPAPVSNNKEQAPPITPSTEWMTDSQFQAAKTRIAKAVSPEEKKSILENCFTAFPKRKGAFTTQLKEAAGVA